MGMGGGEVVRFALVGELYHLSEETRMASAFLHQHGLKLARTYKKLISSTRVSYFY